MPKNLQRPSLYIHTRKWARYEFNITTNLGEDGSRLSGSKEHIALSRKAAQEGMVLLKNSGFLPLQEGSTVALFGIGSVEYLKNGFGSGGIHPVYTKNIYAGFMEKEPRFHVYEPVTRFYYDYGEPRIKELASGCILPEPEVPAELIREAATHADAAIIVIHRRASESFDCKAEKGDFYLSDKESAMIQHVTEAFPHTVVVLNIGTAMDVSWFRNNDRIDAVLLGWYGGMEGGGAVADILCGDVNPSGKLADTLAMDYKDYPSAENFLESEDYVEYTEDIFVGYRYFESFPHAMEKVAYPFGFGLSYTTFALSKPVARKVCDTIEVQVAVTNTGHVPGKEVVQVYFSAPQGKLGKSALELAAFEKTFLLQPGETQNMTLSFPIEQMASYDDLGKCQKSAWVLEQGDYAFYVGTDCRSLQECDFRYTAEEFRVVQQVTQQCAPTKTFRRLLADGSCEELPTVTLKEPEVFAPSGKPKVEETENPSQLIDVAKGKVTMDEFIAQITDEELIKLAGGIATRGVIFTGGMGGIQRLGIPPIMTCDGPQGIRLRAYMGLSTTAFPCATLMACTWNPDLAFEVGRAGAMEAKEHGLGIWLTPGMNIHRNPLCGRNFEYFSEDPLIAGKFAAAKVRGIQSTNTAACPKHLAANNKEDNRLYSDSRVSERALREIYLRGFEICVKESDPWVIMTAYNILNGRRISECRELIQGILRGEWGHKGLVISDWGGPCTHSGNVLAGNDVFMPEPDEDPEELRRALASGRVTREHLENCARHLLEMFLKLE